MSKAPWLPEATLIIDRFRSSCNACGREAKLDEKTHDTELGYNGRGKGFGCGIWWTHVTHPYFGVGKEVTKQLRPDLEYIDAGTGEVG